MCEDCGCRALAPIGELTREHDLVLSLICEARVARTKGDGLRDAACSPRSQPDPWFLAFCGVKRWTAIYRAGEQSQAPRITS